MASCPISLEAGSSEHFPFGEFLFLQLQRFDAEEDLLCAKPCSGCCDPHRSVFIMVLIKLSGGVGMGAMVGMVQGEEAPRRQTG